MEKLSRRQVLGSLGLAAGAGVLGGCNGNAPAQSEQQPADHHDWTYLRLSPADIAAEAYRLLPGNGCMYAIFASIVDALGTVAGEPFRSFPVEMMKYGEAGCGGWGSLCGALNGGAAVIGLFERRKEQREDLISQLFSWYESAHLPIYRPADDGQAVELSKTKAESVLCHVSAGKWCKAAGCKVRSNEMGERCRRLTADVAAKTVALLNENLLQPCATADLAPSTATCIACHDKPDRQDSMGRMSCDACHKFPDKHPKASE